MTIAVDLGRKAAKQTNKNSTYFVVRTVKRRKKSLPLPRLGGNLARFEYAGSVAIG